MKRAAVDLALEEGGGSLAVNVKVASLLAVTAGGPLVIVVSGKSVAAEREVGAAERAGVRVPEPRVAGAGPGSTP